jgi:hypothetical protein
MTSYEPFESTYVEIPLFGYDDHRPISLVPLSYNPYYQVMEKK